MHWRNSSQIKETYERHELNSVQALHSTSSTVEDFYNIENLGIECNPRAKILMRKLWTYETKLDWDDPIPEEYGRDWMIFFNGLPEMEKITVKRCLTPHNAIGDPMLIRHI